MNSFQECEHSRLLFFLISINLMNFLHITPMIVVWVSNWYNDYA